MNKKIKAKLVYDRLIAKYPDVKCSLSFENPLQLMVATQLSAQCTDKRVNIVTPRLFEVFQTASDFANSDIQELEKLIHSTGFYKNKAKNIKEACKRIEEVFGGVVPKDMDNLLSLAGVGRKTANVVLAEGFDIPGMVIDTHVGRLSKRIGLTKNADPQKVEKDLMKLLPDSLWNKFGLLLIALGREICTSRNPKCINCLLCDVCDFCKTKTI